MNYDEPTFRIWVSGRPRSLQARSKASYTERIRTAAQALVPNPTKSPRVDIEVWFCADSFQRADVDNVLKPILDALKGVVYLDDRQVRSVRAVAIPSNDACGLPGPTPISVIQRLSESEFLINIFSGLSLPRGGQ